MLLGVDTERAIRLVAGKIYAIGSESVNHLNVALKSVYPYERCRENRMATCVEGRTPSTLRATLPSPSFVTINSRLTTG